MWNAARHDEEVVQTLATVLDEAARDLTVTVSRETLREILMLVGAAQASVREREKRCWAGREMRDQGERVSLTA